MIIKNNNIFDYLGNCDALCITTNGIVKSNGEAVCGRGVALYARENFPDFSIKLGNHIKKNGNTCGIILNYDNTYIVSFPTKEHWKDKSIIELIKKSAFELVNIANDFKWEKVVIPAPGCSNGGLNFEHVCENIKDILDNRFIITKYEK